MTSRQLPAAQQRSKGLIEAGVALASEIDLDVLLQRIVEVAAGITGARYAALGVLGDDQRIQTFITHGITDQERAAIGDPPTGHGMLGLLIEEARPMRVADIAFDPRSSGFPPNHPQMHSFLGVPVRARGHVFGNIYLTEKQGAPEFDEDDESALIVLAAQAGVAIENARLYEEMQHAQQELRRLEVLEDRERIAKELHDGGLQSLFAVGMGLQGAAAMASDRELARRIENAVEDIDRSIRDLRNYIFGLRPGILADRQLDQAIRELGSEFESRSGVVTVVQIDEEVASELSSRASDLVQMTREALSNVGRHAQARTCRVVLRRDDGAAVLEVDDDGVGFDTETASEGLGLDNLRRRIEQLGGSLDLTSVRGEGTTVTARLPL
jgi:signal transduction histidine kinase